MPVLYDSALRPLLARRRQTLAVVCAVACAVCATIVTGALFEGLSDAFAARLTDVTPHVTMKPESIGGDLDHWLLVDSAAIAPVVEMTYTGEHSERVRMRNAMTVVRSVERAFRDEITAASPYLATQALATYGTNETTLPIVGVIPTREAEVSDLPRHLLSGTVARLEATRDGMLIGAKAAAALGVDRGDRMQLVSFSGESMPVQIIGVYRIGVDAADRAAFVNLRLAQTLDRALPGEATGIGFQVRHVEAAPVVARRIEALSGHATETWTDTNAGAIADLRFLSLTCSIAVGLLLVMCGFVVANMLAVTVARKRSEIEVLRSQGITPRRIARVYLKQSLVIAAVGAAVGSLLAATAIAFLRTVPAGGVADVIPIASTTLPVAWGMMPFAAAIAGTFAVCAIAAIGPSRAAARAASAGVSEEAKQ